MYNLTRILAYYNLHRASRNLPTLELQEKAPLAQIFQPMQTWALLHAPKVSAKAHILFQQNMFPSFPLRFELGSLDAMSPIWAILANAHINYCIKEKSETWSMYMLTRILAYSHLHRPSTNLPPSELQAKAPLLWYFSQCTHGLNCMDQKSQTKPIFIFNEIYSLCIFTSVWNLKSFAHSTNIWTCITGFKVSLLSYFGQCTQSLYQWKMRNLVPVHLDYNLNLLQTT